MGRNMKKGLEYYPMDVDIASDIKIRKLIKRHKGQAFAVYTLLLCNIYKNGYYIHWDEDLPLLIAEQIGLTEEYVMNIIEYCITVGLFSSEMFENEKILTSRSIQERYSFISRQSKRKRTIQEYALIATTDDVTAEVPASEIPRPDDVVSPPPQPAQSIKDICAELGKHVQCREDVWEAAAITSFFTNKFTNFYRRWLSMPAEEQRKYQIHQLNRTLRKDCGEINFDWYYAYGWCKDNLLESQTNEIYTILVNRPTALTELRKLIKEIGRGKINNPGAFILKNLRAL